MKTKNSVKHIFVSCFENVNGKFSVSVTRKNSGRKLYYVPTHSTALDKLSTMANRGAFRQNIALSVYPTLSLTPKRKRKK